MSLTFNKVFNMRLYVYIKHFNLKAKNGFPI